MLESLMLSIIIIIYLLAHIYKIKYKSYYFKRYEYYLKKYVAEVKRSEELRISLKDASEIIELQKNSLKQYNGELDD